MKIQIHCHVEYRYAETVGFSRHTVRLLPRPEHGLRIENFRFATNPGADVQFRRDLFDNNIASCFYPQPSGKLCFDLELELAITEKNAFHFLLDPDVFTFPFAARPGEEPVLHAYRQTRRAGDPGLPFWTPPAERTPTVAVLGSLNSAIHRHIAYERREEGAARDPQETIRLGKGACRDIAWLLVRSLRDLGLAARFASGYLCEFGKEDPERTASGALHAWTEVYLPGAGWVGLDPTNGVWCDHQFITTAVGLNPDDVSPISGSYFSPHHVSSEMKSTLEIVEIE